MTLLQSSASASELPPAVKVDSGSHQLAEAKFCHTWISQSERLNGRGLVVAALGCLREGERAEAAFLMIAGQIRFQVDSITHAPADDINTMKMEKLPELVPPSIERRLVDEVFRDPALKDRLFSLLESWSPVFYEGYYPGWEYISHSGVEKYREWLRDHTEYRVKTIKRYARQIGSDEYQALHSELLELFRRNGGSLSEGSEEERRAQRLLNAMSLIAEDVDPSLVVPGGRDRFNYEPDPNASYKQLHAGWNGPSSVGVVIFDNEKTVKSSWLSRALSEKELRALISEVDFADQILVAFAAGEQVAATGSLYLTDIVYDPLSRSLQVTGKVGAVVRDCPISGMNSYPFAVAVAVKPGGEILDANALPEKVDDGCRSPVDSLPNN